VCAQAFFSPQVRKTRLVASPRRWLVSIIASTIFHGASHRSRYMRLLSAQAKAGSGQAWFAAARCRRYATRQRRHMRGMHVHAVFDRLFRR